jgi:hypothetical protein
MFFEGHGAHGLLFGEKALPPMGMDGLLDRLAKNEKFRSLDDATQDLVREAIRESAPEMAWIGRRGPGEGAMEIVVKQKRKAGEPDETDD